MKKITSLDSNIKLICWDLDGTLFDTELMWFNMDQHVKEQNKTSEEIAAIAYKTWGYRANADKVLNYFKDNNIHQIVINKCDLTNDTMFKNEKVNNTFNFTNFDYIISERTFEDKFTDEDMYKKALELVNITDKKEVVAICDMPFELSSAHNFGLTTIWAKNKEYPFTEEELKEIENIADYYIEDFEDLIKWY